MLLDVAVHVVVGPARDGVELDHAALVVPADDADVGAGRRVLPAHAGDPGLVGRQGAAERLDLAHRAARVGVAVVQLRAVLGVLLGDGQQRQDGRGS